MIYFILAILFVQVLLPVLDGLTSLLLTIIETAKGYFGLKVAKYNMAMREMTSEEVHNVAPIGFSYESNTEEEDIDDL